MSSLIFLFLILLQYKISVASDYFNFTNNQNKAAVFAIVQNGVVAKQSVVGCAKYDTSTKKCLKKADYNTPFQINSMSKQFTATAILLLQERDQLNVDDSITKYLKWLPCQMSEITIKHLIMHFGGLSDYLNDNIDIDLDEYYINKQIVDNNYVKNYLLKNKAYKRNFEKYHYSNTGYVLLAMIVEEVSGKKFADFVNKEIFSKLQMKNTFIVNHSNRKDCLIGNLSWPFNIQKDRDAVLYTTGDRGICTSMNDYIKWLNAIDNNKVFAKEEISRMFRERDKVNGKYSTINTTIGKNLYTYGYGWRHGIWKDNVPYMQHGGVINGANSIVVKFVEKDLWVVFFSNSNTGNLAEIPFEIYNILEKNNFTIK